MSQKKNIMSKTESLLQEISDKLSKLIEIQTGVIEEATSKANAPVEQSTQPEVAMPKVINIKTELKK